MDLSQALQAALIIRLCASAVDVTHMPVFCSEIQTQDGYKFPYRRPAEADLSFLQGETTIATWDNGKQPELLPEVIRLDNNSVITRTCRDLLMKFSIHDGQSVIEIWLNFTTTESSSKPVLRTTGNPVTTGSQVKNNQLFQANTTEPVLPTTESQTANQYIFLTVGALIVVIIGVPVIMYLYWSWKKKWNFLWLFNALKERFSTEGESSEQGENSLQDVVATHPSGSGENGGVQDNPHGSVHDVSVHPRCDVASSLDHKLGNGEFQPTANGHLSNSDVDGASRHGDMNSVRNLRDDPGGSSGDVRLDIPGSDTEAEAEPLVNKGGRDQDRVSRCSATPGPGVESRTRVKNSGDY